MIIRDTPKKRDAGSMLKVVCLFLSVAFLGTAAGVGISAGVILVLKAVGYL